MARNPSSSAAQAAIRAQMAGASPKPAPTEGAALKAAVSAFAANHRWAQAPKQRKALRDATASLLSKGA